MNQGVPLPNAEAVEEMMESLTDCEVQVSHAASMDSLSGGAYIARYILDDGTPAAVSVMELGIALVSAAALGLVPLPPKDELESLTALPEHLLLNYRELVNIFAQLMNTEDGPHVRLSDIDRFDNLPSAAEGALKRARCKVVLSATIAGESGLLIFASVA